MHPRLASLHTGAMLICKACSAVLSSRAVTPVPSDFEPEWLDETEIVPPGHYWIAANVASFVGSGPANECVVINGDDAIGLLTQFPSGSIGCCGNSSHVRNQVCEACDARVGTRIDDCWTGYYTYFRADTVEIAP